MNEIERLKELLNEKDEIISRYQEEEEERGNNKKWGWIKHVIKKENDFPELPLPRLHITCEGVGDGCYTVWNYFIVYKHLVDDIIYVPIGQTRIVGSVKPTIDDLPFRDGCHIKHDMKHFGLPAYKTVFGETIKIKEAIEIKKLS